MSASVLIVDDHPILLQGCRRMLEEMGIATVMEARDIVAGYRLYRRHSPDMTIIDLSFQGNSLAGLTLVQRIKRYDRKARVLVLSMHSDPIIVTRALHAGATGYVTKDAPSEGLLKAVERVLSGQPYLSDELARKIAFAGAGADRGPLAELTPRELQTLGLLAEGKAYGSIAADLNVSYKTVVNTCWQLRNKLAAKNLPDLVRTAVQLLAAK
ncbi:MAG TPA: response regulator transcription factor [Pseudolabrys sp.]|jgi:DNA-binding NarL/FixJ family response regulator|nr:response regulator transcription factor [Pseudolabrys sp.]